MVAAISDGRHRVSHTGGRVDRKLLHEALLVAHEAALALHHVDRMAVHVVGGPAGRKGSAVAVHAADSALEKGLVRGWQLAPVMPRVHASGARPHTVLRNHGITGLEASLRAVTPRGGRGRGRGS